MTPDEYTILATEHVHTCPVCGCRECIQVATVERGGLPARFQLCIACGLVYISPRMPAEAYAEFYRTGEYRRYAADVMGQSVEQLSEIRREGQRDYASAVASALAPWLSGREGQTLLDIGGSSGENAKRLADSFGLRACVLEPSDEERAEAEALGLETIAGTFDAWEPDRRFGVVALLQTLDHFSEPLAVLRKIREVLSDGGLFIVDVVDVRYLVLGFRSTRLALKIDHPCAFTALSAITALARAGFRVLSQLGNNEPLIYLMNGVQHGVHRKALFVCEAAEEHGNALPPKEHAVQLLTMLKGLSNGSA